MSSSLQDMRIRRERFSKTVHFFRKLRKIIKSYYAQNVLRKMTVILRKLKMKRNFQHCSP